VSNLNKHIFMVMKWLDDPKSVSQEEREENSKAAAAAAAAAAAYAFSAFSAFSAAAAAAAFGANAGEAEKWVNKYFERTGENKQDYIDAIEADKKLEEPEAKEWDGEGLPPLNSEVLLCDEEGYLFSSASNEKVSITDDEVLIVVSIGARHDNGNPVVTLMAKDSKNLQGFITVNPDFLEPVKTQEQKDREAFIEKVNCTLFDDAGSVLNPRDAKAVAIKLFDADFKAPEGE